MPEVEDPIEGQEGQVGPEPGRRQLLLPPDKQAHQDDDTGDPDDGRDGEGQDGGQLPPVEEFQIQEGLEEDEPVEQDFSFFFHVVNSLSLLS
ncbi:protein of unknown function [Lactobacillus delbrueckii subsp. delbrueckii]|uniref:GAGE domain-containing protein n=1 Tax=Lactobacillus delbrueckii subsp. delbrueckii TaxID=83684 RepID=A0AAU9R2Q7_9LACO|nr:protein of unknown function [Lactobacillus delbrueckii subsp. delbrueckii]